MFQKCPICNGNGSVNSTPPTPTKSTCPTCKGARIISAISGLPPGYVNKEQPEADQKILDFGIVYENKPNPLEELVRKTKVKTIKESPLINKLSNIPEIYVHEYDPVVDNFDSKPDWKKEARENNILGDLLKL